MDTQENKKEIKKKPELSKEELINLKVCCIKTAKSADTALNEMKYLLNLADKLEIMEKQ